jgi:hypothetical protein
MQMISGFMCGFRLQAEVAFTRNSRPRGSRAYRESIARRYRAAGTLIEQTAGIGGNK